MEGFFNDADHVGITGLDNEFCGRDPRDGLNLLAFAAWLGFMHLCVRRRFEEEIVNVLVDKLAFVHVPIAKPDVDGVQPTDEAQSPQRHLLGNLAHRAGPVRLAVADVTLRERPFPVRVHDHGKVRDAAHTLEN